MAAIKSEGILQIVQPLAGFLVAAVDQPAIGLKQRGRSQSAGRVANPVGDSEVVGDPAFPDLKTTLNQFMPRKPVGDFKCRCVFRVGSVNRVLLQ